jgi:hypothetical protein
VIGSALCGLLLLQFNQYRDTTPIKSRFDGDNITVFGFVEVDLTKQKIVSLLVCVVGYEQIGRFLIVWGPLFCSIVGFGTVLQFIYNKQIKPLLNKDMLTEKDDSVEDKATNDDNTDELELKELLENIKSKDKQLQKYIAELETKLNSKGIL